MAPLIMNGKGSPAGVPRMAAPITQQVDDGPSGMTDLQVCVRHWRLIDASGRTQTSRLSQQAEVSPHRAWPFLRISSRTRVTMSVDSWSCQVIAAFTDRPIMSWNSLANFLPTSVL